MMAPWQQYKRLTFWNKVAFWGSLASLVGLVLAFVSLLSSPSKTSVTSRDAGIAASGNVNVTASEGGTAVVATGGLNVTMNTAEVNEIVKTLTGKHERELSYLKQRERAYQEQIKALTEAVTALAEQKGPSNKEALARLRQGDTEAAEAFFQVVLERKAAKGQVAKREAAAAARHIGALAFLHDTRKALTAYRRAVELDPDNDVGLNRLRLLRKRTGELHEAEAPYRPVLSEYAQVDRLGNSTAQSERCTDCHGTDGHSANPLLPNLAGQNAAYLIWQIKAFRDGTRDHPVIPTLAADLSDSDIADFAAFYAGLKQKSTELNLKISGPELIEKGRSKYTPCTACHGVDGEGISPYPKLAGQQPEYLQQQLMKFKTGARPNTTMRDMSVNLSEDDIEALVMYLATLK